MPGLQSTVLCMQDMSEKRTSHKEKSLYVKMPQAESKGLKRKLLIPMSPSEEHDGEKKSTSKRKRNSLTLESSPEPSNNASPRAPSNPSRIVPLSERQQMALLLRLSEGDASPKSTSPTTTTPSARKTPVDKDKNKANKRNERGETQLHIAAKRGDLKMTKKLIRAGANVNMADYAGWTPLHEACNRGNLQVAKQLLKAGSNVNVQGCENDTPLHDASMNGHQELVELLLKHGANPLQMNIKGKSALDVARSEEIERLLRKEIIASSSSESSSMDDARSPTSPESTSSVVQDDHTQDSTEGDMQSRQESKLRASGGRTEDLASISPGCLSSGARRNLLGKESDKTASPRLFLKFSNKAARDSKEPQLRSYILYSGNKKDSPPAISPISSADSDQFQEHFSLAAQQASQREEEEMPQDSDTGRGSRGQGRVTELGLDPLRKGAGLGGEAEAAPSRNELKYQPTLPFLPSSQDLYPCDSQEDVRNTPVLLLSSSSSKTSPLDRLAFGAKGSVGDSPHIPDQSDANQHRHQPLTFSSSQAASTSLGFRDGGVPDSTNSSSLPVYQSGNGGLASSSTGTNGHMGTVPNVTSSLSPSSSAHSHRAGRTSPYHPPQKQARLSVTSNGPNGSDPGQVHGPSPTSRWDQREARLGTWSGEEEDVSVCVPIKVDRVETCGSQSSPTPRTDRLSRDSQRGSPTRPGSDKEGRSSPRSERGSRPSSPKVPPLKIILSTKSSPATSSSEPDSLKAPTKLYHVLNPTQEQGERLGKEEEEEPEEGEGGRVLLQPPLTRLMASSQNSSQASTSPGSSRPSSRASQGEGEEAKTKQQPQPSASTSSAPKDSGKTQEEGSSEKSQDQVDGNSAEGCESAEKGAGDGEKGVEEKDLAPARGKEEAREEKEERRPTRTLRSHTAHLQAMQQKLEKQEKEKQEKQEKDNDTTHPPDPGSSSPKGDNSEEYDMHPRKRKLRSKTEAQQHAVEPPPLPPMPEKPPNPYQNYLDIRKKVAAKQSNMSVLAPKLPDDFNNYLMVERNYMIQGNASRMFSVPMLSPPNSVTGPMVELFKKQERARYDLRCKHLIEQDKLRLLMEQELMREYTRAARAMANQPLPLSFCTVLRDQEIYNPEELERAEERTVRTRYTGRQLLLWLQDVKDKFNKMKQLTGLRQHHEADSLYVVQRMDWEWKLKELGQCDRLTKPTIDDLQVPIVEVKDNFDLPM